MVKTPQFILAVGAHPDDIELGCGGSLAKLIEEGSHVTALVLSQGRRGADSRMNRPEETRQALERLGVQDIRVLDFPDTKLHENLNEMIATIEGVLKERPFNRVYTMFEHDRHQDHRAVYQASIVACRGVRQILCYETPSSWPNFTPILFEEIGTNLQRKYEALLLHVSQNDRAYTQFDQIETSAKFRGQQVGINPCEGFMVYKFVL